MTASGCGTSSNAGGCFALALRAALTAVVVLLAACGTAPPEPRPDHAGTVAAAVAPLRGLAGVYGLSDFTDVGEARAIGVDVVTGNYSPSHLSFNGAVADHGMSILDTWIQKEIYRSYCPLGPGFCELPSASQRTALLESVRAHLMDSAQSPAVVGYYLVDDYWLDMSTLLNDVYRLVRALSARPTVCGVALPLDYTTSGDASPVSDELSFDRALRNYSPAWCDGVYLYAYGPISRQPSTRSVDWTMASTLEPAMRRLRARGWEPTDHALIGGPQAFGYAPRTEAPGRALEAPEWALTPTDTDLRTQIAAFCAAGASSIIAYAWDDGSAGNVHELYNDPGLQRGFQAGVAECRTLYWR